VNGQKVEALLLTNCKIGAIEPAIPGITDDNTSYALEVDRSRNSAAALMYDDLDNALLALGMCSACAGNAADIYMKQPDSPCASTVANAIAGDKEAIAELQTNPTYCNESSVDEVGPPPGNVAAQGSTPSTSPATSGTLNSEMTKSEPAVAAKQVAADVPVAGGMPLEETVFIKAVADARAAYEAASNDLAAGGVRAQRKSAICGALPSLSVENWQGTIDTLSSNSEGKGVVYIQLAPDVIVGTSNNAITDELLGNHTLIEPNTALFGILAKLQTGTEVRFSGSFFHSDADCVYEVSMTHLQQCRFLSS
jgi:hypothetical protein